MSTIPITRHGAELLKQELHNLKHVERPSVINSISEARAQGDLSENAEYDAAKEAQGLLELKIAKLEQVLGNARVIDESKIDNSKVLALSKVKIKNVKNGAEMIELAFAHIAFAFFSLISSKLF